MTNSGVRNANMKICFFLVSISNKNRIVVVTISIFIIVNFQPILERNTPPRKNSVPKKKALCERMV